MTRLERRLHPDKPSIASFSGLAAGWPRSTLSTRSAVAIRKLERPEATTMRSIHVSMVFKSVNICIALRERMDRVTAIRTVHHEVIDEHAAAVNRVHTGRPVSGTVRYPSIGSIIANRRGPENDHVPAYVLIGYPNVTRGPGFFGSERRLSLLNRHRIRAGRTDATRILDRCSSRSSCQTSGHAAKDRSRPIS